MEKGWVGELADHETSLHFPNKPNKTNQANQTKQSNKYIEPNDPTNNIWVLSTQTAQKQTGKQSPGSSVFSVPHRRLSYRRTENVCPSLINKRGKVLSFWCEFLQNLYKSTRLKTKNHHLGSSSPPTIKLQVRCCFNQLLCIPNTSQQPAENPKTVLWKFGNS